MQQRAREKGGSINKAPGAGVRMGNIGGYEPPHGETDTDAVVECPAANPSRGPRRRQVLLVFTRTRVHVDARGARRLAS